MNLYYSHPALVSYVTRPRRFARSRVSIAEDLGVPFDQVSNIPTLSQAGYGVGIFFISPLGDLARRRQLVLLLLALTAILSIGLALAKSVHVLEGLSFIVGVFTVRFDSRGFAKLRSSRRSVSRGPRTSRRATSVLQP